MLTVYRSFKLTIFAAALHAFAMPALADASQARDRALAYLISHQNGDGSWGSSENDKVRATATALAALRQYNVSGAIRDRAIAWLGNSNPSMPDSLARKIKALADSHLSVATFTPVLIGQAGQFYDVTAQKSYRAWGGIGSYQGAVVDTALAVQALISSGAAPNQSATGQYGAVDYLLGRLGAGSATSLNGGWGYEAGDTSIPNSAIVPTSQAILALTAYGAAPTAVNSAAAWLVQHAVSTGGFGDNNTPNIVSTALAVNALAQASQTTTGAYTSAINYLLNNIAADGSWESDAYATAMSASALFNGSQNLADSDGDGVPDSVELILGTNPNQFDNWGQRNNGDNANTYLGSPIVITGTTSSAIATALGSNAVITGGQLPAGVSLSGSQLIGTPQQSGVFNFTYASTQANGQIVVGTGQIRVGAPLLNNDTSSPTAIVGDVNGDGVVDIADLYLLQQYLLGAVQLYGSQAQRADANPIGSGSGPFIDIADLYALQQKILSQSHH